MYFVDYGMTKDVMIADCLKLDPKFLIEPAFLVCCKLNEDGLKMLHDVDNVDEFFKCLKFRAVDIRLGKCFTLY